MSVAGSTPYRWPYDGRLSPQTLALVVAGADARWMEATPSAARHLAALARLARDVLTIGGLVVRVSHLEGDATPFASVPATVVLRAGGIDGFYASALDSALRTDGRTFLALSGFGLEGPVHSTLRSANDRGYECLTLRDACVPMDQAVAAHAYSTIEMSGGIFGAVGTSTALLAALTTNAPQEVE